MTYADFTARLIAALTEDTASDDGWSTYLPAIIEQAELRCYRDVDFLAVRKKAVVTTAIGAESFAAPADWLLGQGISITTGGYVTLDRREEEFLREYAPSGVTGRPRYWNEPTQGQILMAPPPDKAYALELRYHARPATLSPTNTTTWLATNAPDLMFYAAMVAAAGYLKNFGAQADDPRSAMSWEQMYQTALRAVLREEGRRKGDNDFDSSAAPPPSSNLPPAGQG